MSGEHDWLAERFEAHRGHLRRVAFRMLGSLGEADDATRKPGCIEPLRTWAASTTWAAGLPRCCRASASTCCACASCGARSRSHERTVEYAPVHVDRPSQPGRRKPSWPIPLGLALLVVLETLDTSGAAHPSCCTICSTCRSRRSPPSSGRTPAATKAAREPGPPARARSTRPGCGEDYRTPAQGRRCLRCGGCEAGDFEALVAVLDPDVVFHADVAGRPSAPVEVRGARAWAKGAIAYRSAAAAMQPALVNGSIGLILAPHGRLLRALTFDFAEGRIRAAEIISDPARIHSLEVAVLA